MLHEKIHSRQITTIINVIPNGLRAIVSWVLIARELSQNHWKHLDHQPYSAESPLYKDRLYCHPIGHISPVVHVFGNPRYSKSMMDNGVFS